MCTDTPKIYVADLAEYNSGNLVGQWFDLTEFDSKDELLTAIAEMLKARGNEEWAIHDTECMPDMGEWPDLEHVLEVSKLIEEYDYESVKAFIDHFGDDCLNEFEDRYCGKYDSAEDYAYEFIRDCYDLEKMMGNLSNYFDYEAFARDLQLSGDMYFADVDGGVIAFRNC